MKEGIKFIVSYSVLSICLFAISRLFLKELTSEIFSYLMFYYFITMFIGILLYPILGWLMIKYNLGLTLKLISSFVFCIVIINVIPFIYDDKRILLLDALRGVFEDRSKLGFNNLGIHLVAAISFAICYLSYRKTRPFE
jgi:hypothetical protein